MIYVVLYRIAVFRIQAKPKLSSSPNHLQLYSPRNGRVQNIFISFQRPNMVYPQRISYFQGGEIGWKKKTGKREGVKKHLRGLVDAPVRNDDTAHGCMQSRFQLQRNFRISRSMLFFTTAAHFTWFRHVHLHITTSHLLKRFLHSQFLNIIAECFPSSFRVLIIQPVPGPRSKIRS